jgi:hypothetical protein
VLISITSSKPNDEERHRIDEFLEQLLPRVEHFPGTHGVYHFWRAEESESVTIIIWESEDALMSSRVVGRLSRRRSDTATLAGASRRCPLDGPARQYPRRPRYGAAPHRGLILVRSDNRDAPGLGDCPS